MEVFKNNRAVTNGTIFIGNREALKFQNHYDNDNLLSAVEFEGRDSQSLSSVDLWKAMTTLYPESIKTINSFSLMETQILPKVITPSAANWTTLWTPSSKARFRLFSGLISIPIGSTTAASLFILLQEWKGASAMGGPIFSVEVSTGAMAATTQPILIPIPLPPDGYLASEPDRILRVYLSTAMTAGEVDVSVMGIEE